MSEEDLLDEESIVAMIVDDVQEMLKTKKVNQKGLLKYDSKWRAAGASSQACKVARLLMSSFDVYQNSQNGNLGLIAFDLSNAMTLLRGFTPYVENSVGTSLGAKEVNGARKHFALIMKGGGIKGLAYVGAVEQLSQRYEFNWYVGTSAGAVSAVLLAAGYSVDELREILKSKNFKDFFDARGWAQKCFNLAAYKGLHHARSFTEWLDSLLAKKLNKHSRVRLSDLPHRVTIYASQRNASALRYDSYENDADAAYAARCSMSIPFVFVPQSNQGLRTYDGGLQNNFPVKDLLERHPETPFLSLFLGAEIYEPVRERWVFSDLLSIWMESADSEIISKYPDSTVIIDPRPIGTLDFDLTDDEKEYLLACGRTGALAHHARNSKEHTEAQKSRDELKAKVEIARHKKKRRRLLKRELLFASIYFVFVAAYFYYLCLKSGLMD